MTPGPVTSEKKNTTSRLDNHLRSKGIIFYDSRSEADKGNREFTKGGLVKGDLAIYVLS